MIIEPKPVSFFSDELKIAGLLALPDGEGPYPGVVMPQGTVGLKEHYRSPKICSIFADAGYAALTFDYRGFGESEGHKEQIVPLDQVQDIRNALTFLAAQPRVDAKKLILFGFCWGGTHCIYVGGTDSRVKCVATVGAVGDGYRWLRSLRRCWEWYDFISCVEKDRTQRVLTGNSKKVPFGDILVGSPNAKKGRDILIKESPISPPYHTPGANLHLAERIMEYKPEKVVEQIAPRPLLIMHCELDDLVPLEEAKELYRIANEPKELIVFPGAIHHEVYVDPLFDNVMNVTLKWFKKWINS